MDQSCELDWRAPSWDGVIGTGCIEMNYVEPARVRTKARYRGTHFSHCRGVDQWRRGVGGLGWAWLGVLIDLEMLINEIF